MQTLLETVRVVCKTNICKTVKVCQDLIFKIVRIVLLLSRVFVALKKEIEVFFDRFV